MARIAIATRIGGGLAHGLRRLVLAGAVAGLAAACGGNYAAKPDTAPTPGPTGRKFDPNAPTVFGKEGLQIGTISSSDNPLSIFGAPGEGEGQLPVNKYLWQASLDTLSFLPLASTDPFTGVIATDWGVNPAAPGERFKVTAYITSPALSAASLKVAVYREVQNEQGQWLPAPVSAETARKLEDAILIRAREIRIAEREGKAAS